ncbi:hypothetical protein QYF36_015058 [Acer negundo]|nr:hypothetical protein QYF36_015058 [Acer negundo]
MTSSLSSAASSRLLSSTSTVAKLSLSSFSSSASSCSFPSSLKCLRTSTLISHHLPKLKRSSVVVRYGGFSTVASPKSAASIEQWLHRWVSTSCFNFFIFVFL